MRKRTACIARAARSPQLALCWDGLQGLMRKRIACINEAPIRPEERRIAVHEGQQVVHNAWLAEQVV